MSLKELLGLGDIDISEREIVAKIEDAINHGLETIEFVAKDGSKITIRLPHGDFSKYIDPWDSKVGKGNYPNI